MSQDHAAFIRANTQLRCVSFVPEIRLYLADDATALWQKTETDFGRRNLPPPFWAFAWAGGQALARYMLDDPAAIAGRHVLDFASGSGLCGLAAARAGAARVQAVDIDPYATAAMALNAAANALSLEIIQDDLVGATGPWSVILAGDISYQKDVAARVHDWLRSESRRGVLVLIGDPDRAYLPRATLKQLAVYDVPVMPDLEDVAVKRSFVLTVATAAEDEVGIGPLVLS